MGSMRERVSTAPWVLSVLLTAAPSLAEAPAESACPPGAFCEEVATSPDGDESDEAADDERDGLGGAPAAEAPSVGARAGWVVADGAEGDGGDDVALPDRELDEPPTGLASEHPGWRPEGWTHHGSDEPSPPPCRTCGSPVVQAGLGLFLGGYAAPFAVGMVSALIVDDVPEALPLVPLLVPAAGPLITAALYDASPAVWGLLGATSGVQTLGLVVLAMGLSLPDEGFATSTVIPTADGLAIRF